jgi:hypothetical protein
VEEDKLVDSHKVSFKVCIFISSMKRFIYCSSVILIRTPVQVKTHAQVILKKLASGTNINDYLLDKNDSINTLGIISQKMEDHTSDLIPSKLIHTTPNDKDIDAAHILAKMQRSSLFPCADEFPFASSVIYSSCHNKFCLQR